MEVSFKTDIKKWLDNLKKLQPKNTGISPRLQTDSQIHGKLKAVIFDIYGTLLISASGDVDQAYLSAENMERALKAGGYNLDKRPLDTAAYVLNLLPQKIKENHSELKQKGHPFPEIDIFYVWANMLEDAQKAGLISLTGKESASDAIFVFEVLSNKVFPMPGMKEVLTRIHEMGIPLGIVSNAQFYTPVIMNYFLTGRLSTKMDIELFNHDLSVFSFKELRSKPDVTLFNKFIPVLKNKYGIEPSEAIFVGNDMLKDIYTAQKAGLKTVLFAGDERSLRLRENDERVAGIEPDFIITELKQLLEIIS